MFGGWLKSSGIGPKNNAIFWKYSSPDKSCQGQTYGRLRDRKHYLCTRLFAWRALLKEQNCLGTAAEVVEVQLVQVHQTFFLKTPPLWACMMAEWVKNTMWTKSLMLFCFCALNSLIKKSNITQMIKNTFLFFFFQLKFSPTLAQVMTHTGLSENESIKTWTLKLRF